MWGQLNPCERTLPDGIYRIATVNNIDFNIGVEGNSAAENAKIKLYHRDTNKESQLFLIEYLTNFVQSSGGYNYRIKNVQSGKYLRPGGDSPWDTSYDIIQSTNDQNGARWIIENGGNGTYRIRSATGNYCIDLNKGNPASGEQIHTWASTMGNTQQWVFMPVGTQTIPNGEYEIYSKSDAQYLLDKDPNSDNVQIYKLGPRDHSSQKWTIKYNKDTGYYTLKNKHNNKYLQVSDASFTSGAQVSTNSKSAIDATQFVINPAGNGSFHIIHKNGLFVDVDGGKMENGTNVQGWRGSSVSNQQWTFVKVDSPSTINDGIYRIACFTNSGLNLDISDGSRDDKANLQIYGNNASDAQCFQVTFYNKDGGYYKIQNVNSGKYLAFSPTDDSPNNVAQQHWDDNNTKQRWEIGKSSDGSYYIKNKSDSRLLDVQDAKFQNSANVQVWTGNSNAAQKWNFEYLGAKVAPISDGYYKILCKHSEKSNYCFDVELESRQNNASVHPYTYCGGLNQKWYVKHLGGSYYSIVAVHSGKALDVVGASSTSGTALQQYKNKEKDGELAQQWLLYLVPGTPSSYYIINRKSLFAGRSNDDPSVEGTKINGYNADGSDKQRWVFERIDPDGPVLFNGQYASTVCEGIKLADNAGGGTIQLRNFANIESDDAEGRTILTPKNEITIDLNGKSFLVNGVNSYDVNGNSKVTILLKDDGFTSYTNECQVTGSPVKYVRDLPTTTRAGKWQALYLPFSAEAPSGYEFGSPKRGSVSQSSAKLVFEKGVTSLGAKKHYFVRSSDGKVTITQQNATLLPYTTPEQEAYAEGSNLGIKGSLHNDDNVADADKAFWVLTNGGKFTWAKAGSHQRPYHWVIYVPNNSIAALNLFEEDDEETALEDIEAMDEESNEPIYTIGGIRVNSSNLAPGIYVRGGKKFVVR